MPDAIVIGAGPAGSMAALLLARAGWGVTLVEQSKFPREKVCGECMSALGLSVLDRAGLLPRLRNSGMIPLRRASVWATDGQSIDLDLPQEMAGLSRAILDVELRNAAVEAGARLLQPARCEGIDGGTAPTVSVRALSNNQVSDIRGDIVLVADGKGGVTAGGKRPVNGDLGVKCHLTGIDGPRDAIELFGLRGHYTGLAAIDGGRWNLAMSVPKTLVRQVDGDFDRLLRWECEQNRVLGQRMLRASRVSAWHSSPLPRFGVSKYWQDGVIPIGNAAAALEPIGGEGMGLALASAEIAVEHLRQSTDVNVKLLRSEYRRLWSQRRAWCRLAAIIASRPTFATVAVTLAGSEKMLGLWVAGKMGKTQFQTAL